MQYKEPHNGFVKIVSFLKIKMNHITEVAIITIVLGIISLAESVSFNGNNGRQCGECPSGTEREEGYGSYCGPCVPIDTTCREGTYRDNGKCKDCPCPTASGRFNGGCYKDSYGDIICKCQEEYTGKGCRSCSPGCKQNDEYPYDCKRTDKWKCSNGDGKCPPRGSNRDDEYNRKKARCDTCSGEISRCDRECGSCHSCSNRDCERRCISRGCNRCRRERDYCDDHCDECERNECPPQRECPECPIRPPCDIKDECPPQKECPPDTTCPPTKPCDPPNVICPPCANCTTCPSPCGNVTCPSPCKDCPSPCQKCPSPCRDNCPNPCRPCPECSKSITCTPCICDLRGMAFQHESLCICKANVMGATCNICKPGYFGLSQFNPVGCSQCFCSGLSTNCQSAIYFRSSQHFTDGIQLTNRIHTLDTEILENGEYRFQNTDRYNGDLFWSIPFTGNRITSYGGWIKVLRKFSNRGPISPNPDHDVIIVGKYGMALFWNSNDFPSSPSSYSVMEAELSPKANWLFLRDNLTRIASRWEIMEVLQDVSALFIRASLVNGLDQTYIKDISIDFATKRRQPGFPVFPLNIEQCQCPMGYQGLSCESCSQGHYRDTSETTISIFGSCRKCPCGRNSLGCFVDEFSTVICKCKKGFSGPRCQTMQFISLQINPSYVHDCSGTNVVINCTSESTSPYVMEFEANIASSVSGREISAGIMSTNVVIKGNMDVICTLKDPISRKTIAFAVSTIEVSDEEYCMVKIPDYPPHISIEVSPPFLCIKEGESARFACIASEYNANKINEKWTKEGAETEQLDVRQENKASVLAFHNAEISHSGTYICSAAIYRTDDFISLKKVVLVVRSRNVSDCEDVRVFGNGTIYFNNSASILPVMDQGQPDNEKNTQLTFPRVRLNPASIQRVFVGSKVTLECEATGEPTPSVLWSRYFEDRETEELVEASTPNAVFELLNVSKKDEGKYGCTARNSMGSSTESIQLLIDERKSCSEQEFRCRSGDQCVLKLDRCDGENDCMDGSDEVGCQRRTRHLRHHNRVVVEA